MKEILKFIVFILFFGALIHISCKKEYSCEGCVDKNKPPIAVAGPDQVITLPTDSVSLNGMSSSDPDGIISIWLWTKISGPASSTINRASDSITKVKTLVTGNYFFELKVTDNAGLSAKDTIQIIVNAAVSNNNPPVAIAGNDTIIQTNQTSCTPVPITITLNGSNSYDSDGSITSFLWSGSNSIANPNSASTTITGSFQGTISIILKVTDNNGAVGYDTVRISILPARPQVQAYLIPIGTLSQSRSSFAVAAAGNKLVFAGGWINDGNSSPSSTRVDIYDIASGSWSIAQLSEGRFNTGVAVLGNKIFFAGGGRQQVNSGTWQYEGLGSSVVDIFDVVNNSWSTAQLSSPRVPVGASAGNKVVFAGGDDMYVSAQVDIYDGITNTWTSRSLSEAKYIRQIAISGNKIFLAGGSGGIFTWAVTGSHIYKQIDILDASTGAWSVDHLSFERGEMGAIGVNNKIYWGGGMIVNTQNGQYVETSSVEIRDLASNTTSFDCLSEPRVGYSAVKKDNKIIFFGGGLYSNSFDIYDLTTNLWSIGILPRRLFWPSIISYNNILYVAGGEIDGNVSPQVYKLEF